jgi:AmiR/NasT family two-component response regulator
MVGQSTCFMLIYFIGCVKKNFEKSLKTTKNKLEKRKKLKKAKKKLKKRQLVS